VGSLLFVWTKGLHSFSLSPTTPFVTLTHPPTLLLLLLPQYSQQSATLASLNAERASLEAENVALKRVEAEHRALLAQNSMASRNESAMSELRESHKEKIAAMRESHEAALSRAVQSAGQQMAELQRAGALELERTRMEWEGHCAELTKRHGEELSRLKDAVQAAEAVRSLLAIFCARGVRPSL